jgi:hypothetical protein
LEEKIFNLKASEIMDIYPNKGSCIASDKITVDGLPIGYMYREVPDFETDSGWRFFSGTEDDDYVNTPSNLMIYDLNTIVNYDNSLIKYLESRIGEEFERTINNTFKKID